MVWVMLNPTAKLRQNKEPSFTCETNVMQDFQDPSRERFNPPKADGATLKPVSSGTAAEGNSPSADGEVIGAAL
jgi:hypothetical protein